MNSNSNNNNNSGSASVTDNVNPSNQQPISSTVEMADPMPSTDMKQTMQFVDDTALQSVTLPNPILPNVDILSGSLEDREHTVADVLSRPVVIGNVTWADTQTENSEIATYNFPEKLISSSPNIPDKLAHFTFLRPISRFDSL